MRSNMLCKHHHHNDHWCCVIITRIKAWLINAHCTRSDQIIVILISIIFIRAIISNLQSQGRQSFCQIVWHTCSEKTWLLYCHCPIKLDHSPASKCNIYLCWQILIRIPKHFFRCVSLSVSGVWAECSHSPVFVRGKKVALCRGWNAVRQCACGRPWLDEPAPTSSAVRAQAARCVLAGWAQTGRASSETGCRTIGPQPAYALSSWKSTPWTKALISNSVWISRLLVDCNFCENYLDLLPVPRPSWQ